MQSYQIRRTWSVGLVVMRRRSGKLDLVALLEPADEVGERPHRRGRRSASSPSSATARSGYSHGSEASQRIRSPWMRCASAIDAFDSRAASLLTSSPPQ